VPDTAPSPPPDDLSRGPLFAWRGRLASGLIRRDPSQEAAVERLQSLWHALDGYDQEPEKPERGGLLARLGFGRKRFEEASTAPNGLYLVGPVGRGKSLLMDLFFAAVRVRRKRRVHFHAFMQDVHARIHHWRRPKHRTTADPIPPLADQLAAEAALLCFDEFQVHDIVDAMILGRLFQALFERGVVVVATSNTLPDDLYAEGLQRQSFLPFIALLKERLDLLVVDGGRDFRRDRVMGLRSWHVPADAAADAALDRAFAELTAGETPRATTLLVMGRRFRVPLAASTTARFDFEALCGTALGPGDYLALAGHFHTLVLDNVPQLTPENFDKAKRFITLIDALYEHKVKLIASAAAEPDELYREGENATSFQRTASRLIEMQGAEYLAMPHLA
jgi:cell division protein ZapE